MYKDQNHSCLPYKSISRYILFLSIALLLALSSSTHVHADNIQGESTLGDFIWHDLNHNGLQDTGEPGLNGVLVQLYLDDGDFVFDPELDQLTSGLVSGDNPSTPQREEGWYDFSVSFSFERFHWVHIAESNYAMGGALSGFAPTKSEVGANENIDNNFDPSLVIETQLIADRNDVDFGFIQTPPASIGDLVWHDLNQNGIQDGDEPGLADVSIMLFSAVSRQQIATTQSDAVGRYLFENLTPGEYYLMIDPPASFQLTQPHVGEAGSDLATDSDADPSNRQTPPIAIESDTDYENIDFGLYQPAALGDRVWEDRDGDGNQDADEAGLPNVTVNLYHEQDGLVQTVATDAQGNYFFEDVTPGRYSLEFVTPAGYLLTEPSQSDPMQDSDPDPTDGRTSRFELQPGDILLGLDAGMYSPAQIQGRLWEDGNGNGLREESETGIQGGLVTLYDDNGNTIQEFTTDSSGAYNFDNLPPGDYRVGFTPPASSNFNFSQPTNNQQPITNNQIDSSVDPSTGQSGLYTLLSGDTLSAVDAGVYKPASVGDRVWHDSNGNGIQEPDEAGLAGVQVSLHDASSGDLIGTVVSDEDGEYTFQDLIPGTYYLAIEPLEGWRFSPAIQGNDPTSDSDVDPVTQTTQSFTLQSGGVESSMDAALYQPFNTSGQVWEDGNGNGILDSGEPLLGDVTVLLYDENGALLATAITNADGSYTFDNLLPGEYQLEFTPPSEGLSAFSPQRSAFSLPDGAGKPVSAAFYRPAMVGDWVWLDLNGNGLQDEGEMGLAGIEVSLYADGDSGTPLAQTVTDADGHYQFTDLLPGNYILAFENLPTDHIFSPQQPTPNNQQPITNHQTDSDVDPATGQTAPFALSSGEVNEDQDAGVMPPDHLFTIGDRVWHDGDQNGIEDGDEGGIADVRVELYGDVDCAGEVIANTTTNEDGYYQFSGLEEGAYCLHFTGYPTTWLVHAKEVGLPEDPFVVVESGSVKIANISLTENDSSFDLGFWQTGQLEGLVWCENDTNPNRAYNAGEDTELSEQEVRLLADADCDGLADSSSSIAITMTDATGHYQFTDLSILLASADAEQSQDHPTCYVVEMAENMDEDALCPHAITPLQQPITLHAAQPDSQDHNFGFTAEQVYTLSDRVWVDQNRDGVQDPDETGLSDIDVLIFENSSCDGDALETTSTDVNGDYAFPGLTAGTYCLQFQGTPEKWLLISPNNGNLETGQVTFEDVTIDDNLPNLALALAPEVVTIGDQVWLDENLNGLQDEGEPGVADVRVLLLLTDGTPTGDVTVTDENGFYQFTDIPPGDYIIQFDLSTLPSDHVPSSQPSAVSSQPDPITGQTAPTGFLADGTVYDEADMGIYQPLRIGDRVWEDWNANGLQDPNEPRIPGVSVTLHTADGTVVAEQLTDSAGHYAFTGLAPGEYYVSMDPQNLFLPTIANAGANAGDDTADSDLEDGRTPTTILTASGDADDTLDIGLIRPIEVSGRVWLDSDENGLQDEDESGIADIGVALFHSDGRPVERDGTTLTTLTDAGGRYTFDGLMPGSYYVQFDYSGLDAPHLVSPQDVGEDDTIDNDTNPENSQTAPTAFLISGDRAEHLDLGLYEPARVQVGDRVWLDLNVNGLQDEGEPGVGGIKVLIFDQANTLMGERVTDENGNYLFIDLPKGEYSVVFDLTTLPTDHKVTAIDVGEDDRADSDVGPETGRTGFTELLDNDDVYLDLDMGIYTYAQLGDRVWEDRNANGLQDGDEPGLAGVVVTLLDGEGQPTGQAVTTDESGNFVFADLMPGSYRLQFDPPESYFASPDHQGGVETVERDSNVNADTLLTPVIVLESGQVDLSWDAGFYAGAILGDFVWEDSDGNGLQDEGELGIPDVLVELFTVEGEFAGSTTTDATGHYRFEGITPNDYYLRFTPPPGLTYTRPKNGDKTKDSDVDPITGRSNQLTLSPGINDLDQDAGFTRPASVGNFVWVDSDGDGIKDGEEPGIGNMVVNIYNADDELVNTVLTDSLGFFEFTNLAPGDYRLEFLTPAGYTFTEQNRGGPNDFNSDADPLNGRTQLISLSPGEADGNWGAGIRPEDDGEDGDGITAVELLRFEAIQQEGVVQVIWETGEEIDTFGFHLYRSTNGDRNQAARITPNMIRGKGATGGVYQVDDTAVLPGVVYIYWLRETEISGRTIEYGPTGFSAAAASRAERSYQTFLPMVYR